MEIRIKNYSRTEFSRIKITNTYVTKILGSFHSNIRKQRPKKNSLMKRSNEAKNGIQNTFYFGRFSTFKKTSIKYKRRFLVECLRCKYKNPRNRHSSVFLFFLFIFFFFLPSRSTKHDKLFSKSICNTEIRRTRKI